MIETIYAATITTLDAAKAAYPIIETLNNDKATQAIRDIIAAAKAATEVTFNTMTSQNDPTRWYIPINPAD